MLVIQEILEEIREMINKINAVSTIVTPIKNQQNMASSNGVNQSYVAQQEQQTVSFEGLGSFIAGIFKSNPQNQLEKQRKAAIKDLISKEYGMYVLKDNKLIPVGFDNFENYINDTKEIIVKDNPETQGVMLLDDEQYSIKLRTGMIPEQILHALDNKVERLTLITDAAIQILKLPTDAPTRKEYFDKLRAKKDEATALYDSIDNAFLDEKEGVLFDGLKNMIKDMPEISLEFIPLSQKKLILNSCN